MSDTLSRRSFLSSSVAAAAVTSLGVPAAVRAGQFTGKIKKAIKYHMITSETMSVEDKFKMVKDLGFDGIEPRAKLRRDDPKQLARAAAKLDLPIHGVVNSSNRDLRGAIDQAKMYGANSVLTTIPAMPKKGSYLENYQETQQVLLAASDYAEQHEVYILIENVWASFLIEPIIMARYIDEIDSPFVKVYFDVGNVVRWGWPQNWIQVLGDRIVKLDIKEYNLDIAMNEGMRKAFGVPLGNGSVEWEKVRHELAKLDFTGWATAEVAGGGRSRLADVAEQMNRVLDL